MRPNLTTSAGRGVYRVQTTVGHGVESVRRNRRDSRWLLRDHLAHGLSSLPRVRTCGRRMTDRSEGVGLVYDESSGVAHYSRVQTCGSGWACPVCAPKIRAARAAEVETGLAAHFAAGGSAEFVSVTLRHHKGDRLRDLLDVLQTCLRKIRSGRTWQTWRDTYGIVGVIAAREITHGESGWHPHAHLVVLFDHALTDDQRDALSGAFRARWAKLVKAETGRQLHAVHGVDWRRVVGDWDHGQEIARYLVKVEAAGLGGVGRGLGNELARGDLKVARRESSTPAEIVTRLVALGDVADMDLWHEYERATRGLPILTWSKGLRVRLGLVADAPTDEELAAAEVGGDEVVSLGWDDWHRLVETPGARTRLLRLLEAGRGGLPSGWLRLVLDPSGLGVPIGPQSDGP